MPTVEPQSTVQSPAHRGTWLFKIQVMRWHVGGDLKDGGRPSKSQKKGLDPAVLPSEPRWVP